jgi:hypothetical protein
VPAKLPISIGLSRIRARFWVEKRENLIFGQIWPIPADICLPKYAGNFTFWVIKKYFVGIFSSTRAQKLRVPAKLPISIGLSRIRARSWVEKRENLIFRPNIIIRGGGEGEGEGSLTPTGFLNHNSCVFSNFREIFWETDFFTVGELLVFRLAG